MKVAIYTRVSTSDQSTDLQMRDLEEFVKARGFEVFHVYQDVGVSGASSSRPELNKLMDAARKRKFKAVIVWKFDRFARSLKHLVTALDEFKELGIDFISYKENLDTSTSVGKLMFNVIGSMAEFERDIIKERVISGLKTVKSKGVKLGRPAKTKNVSLIEKLRSQNKSITEIANETGLSRATIHRTLREILHT